MEQKNGKVISIKLIYVIILLILVIVGITLIIEYLKGNESKIAAESNIGIVEKDEIQIAKRQEKITVTSRGENITRNEKDDSQEDLKDEEINNNENLEEMQSKNEENEENPEKTYININDVKISQNMDLTVRTGLSREDFIKLISGVKADTSGFFEENAGIIYDLCEEYSLNEIFFCGIISAESGWQIAQNHRSTHNYISLMSKGKLLRFDSVESGLREAARVLHTNYLTKGGKYYYGKTLSAVKTKFCPESSTWVSLVYGRMSQIIK